LVAEKPKDDFFDEANWNKSPSKNSLLVKNSSLSSINSADVVSSRVSPTPANSQIIAHTVAAPETTPIPPSEDVVSPTTARRVSATTLKKTLSTATPSESSGEASLSSSTSNMGKKKGGKLGVKKVALGISFDEMEAKAKEEAAKYELADLLDMNSSSKVNG
jgi:hypothetical protein